MRRLSFLLICFPLIVSAGRLHPERYYQDIWCAAQDGITEARLVDGTRADCLTMEYAIEVDFADKWAEAIGQSQHYARLTGLQPGVLLVLEEEKDSVYLERLLSTTEKVCPYIKVWTISP